MKDTVILGFQDGRKVEIELPQYGHVVITTRNGKVVESNATETKKYYK